MAKMKRGWSSCLSRYRGKRREKRSHEWTSDFCFGCKEIGCDGEIGPVVKRTFCCFKGELASQNPHWIAYNHLEL